MCGVGIGQGVGEAVESVDDRPKAEQTSHQPSAWAAQLGVIFVELEGPIRHSTRDSLGQANQSRAYPDWAADPHSSRLGCGSTSCLHSVLPLACPFLHPCLPRIHHPLQTPTLILILELQPPSFSSAYQTYM